MFKLKVSLFEPGQFVPVGEILFMKGKLTASSIGLSFNDVSNSIIIYREYLQELYKIFIISCALQKPNKQENDLLIYHPLTHCFNSSS